MKASVVSSSAGLGVARAQLLNRQAETERVGECLAAADRGVQQSELRESRPVSPPPRCCRSTCRGRPGSKRRMPSARRGPRWLHRPARRYRSAPIRRPSAAGTAQLAAFSGLYPRLSCSLVVLGSRCPAVLGIGGRSPALARASGDHPGNVPGIGCLTDDCRAVSPASAPAGAPTVRTHDAMA